jgi:hypothetical protein
MSDIYYLDYVRFLKNKHDIDLILNFKFCLNLLDLRILETIAIFNFQNQNLNVSDIMRMSEIASPATIHRSMKKLLDKKLIFFVFKNSNQKIKYLNISPLGGDYFGSLGAQMHQVSQQLSVKASTD